MVKFLRSQAKVVRNTVISVLSLFLSHPVNSQVVTPSRLSDHKITLNCDRCSFQQILIELENKSGLHLIYSSSIVHVNKIVSVKVEGKSIDEALVSLGSSTGMMFKRNGRHIVIKNREALMPSAASVQLRKSPQARIVANPEKKISGASGNIGYESNTLTATSDTAAQHHPVLRDVVFRKPPPIFSQYYDAKRLPGLPPGLLKSVNLRNNNPGWFISAGLVLNDYSAGVELQAGLRPVFLVFSPTWLKDGRYHAAYGIGTSMLLDHNLSIATLYTRAVVNKPAEYSKNIFELISRDVLASSSNHHQLRMMLQYDLTRKISLRAGLSVNYLVTTKYLPEPVLTMTATDGYVDNLSGATTYSSFPYRRVVVRRHAASSDGVQASRTWMGWQTSLSYRFNFFQRRK